MTSQNFDNRMMMAVMVTAMMMTVMTKRMVADIVRLQGSCSITARQH